ncbi:DUF427 domain-containing protein [Microbacterium esteraromaticum]|uniref:DUF427 domain-containing protein n=1 Tax=Microbacterium esteraromaticum TaxID=57043 RepID=UPI0019D34C5F|nr:DUF427 domain-containing protein [Microbacterium esteraromaticum]MBN7794069.1 DUF427 domain-containing protein [Microbacterium esteraromaticum]
MSRPQPEPARTGEESVWDYPRPPRVEPVRERVTITLGGVVIADTTDAVRVLETSHPPQYYLPIDSFIDGALTPAEGSSFCEFKGEAAYFDVHGGDQVVPRAAWTYPRPTRRFAELSGRVAVYAGEMDACTVGNEHVTPQPGRFYGGWITSPIRGPFKGVPGSMGW